MGKIEFMWTILLVGLALLIKFKEKDMHPLLAIFLSGLLLAPAYSLVEYFQSDEGKEILLAIIVFAFAGWVALVHFKRKKAHKKEIEARENSLLAASVTHISRQEYIRGFIETKRFGWVRTCTQENRENVEYELKLEAARLGANALINYYWSSDNETYQAGTGPKGNPYYKNRRVYGGEAIAISISKSQSPQKNERRRKERFRKVLDVNLVLDGSNIVGHSGWDFTPLKALVSALEKASIRYIVFFDNSIFRTLKERGKISEQQDIHSALSNVLSIQKANILVTPVKEEADPYIIEYASKNGSAVVSRDNFEDFKDEYPWLMSSDRKLNFSVVNGEILVPKLAL